MHGKKGYNLARFWKKPQMLIDPQQCYIDVIFFYMNLQWYFYVHIVHNTMGSYDNTYKTFQYTLLFKKNVLFRFGIFRIYIIHNYPL